MSTDTTIQVQNTQLAVTVFDAIEKADFAANGAPFAPLLVKFTTASELTNGWNSDKGETQISFFTSTGKVTGDFLPLGDVATINNASPGQAPVMLVAAMPGEKANDGRDLLAHPTGFEWILDDKHSGNDHSVTYFWPTAPDGYEAVGICFGFDGATPDVNDYWCVHKQLLQSVPTQAVWGDGGQGWASHNGDLQTVNLLTQVSPDQDNLLLLAPTTFLSVEKGGNLGRSLILGKAVLPDSSVPVPDPAFYDNCQENDTTEPGMVAPVVLPCTVVSDANQNSTPLTDPFYYLASEPYWECLLRLPAEKATAWSQKLTVGTSKSSSKSFQETSSLTVGAESGVEAEGLSAKISVSFTNETQIGTVDSTDSSTSVEVDVQLDLPTAKLVFIWREKTDLVLYRTSGSTSSGAGVVSTVPFEKKSVTYTHSPS